MGENCTVETRIPTLIFDWHTITSYFFGVRDSSNLLGTSDNVFIYVLVYRLCFWWGHVINQSLTTKR
jgi:hypothetical protein